MPVMTAADMIKEARGVPRKPLPPRQPKPTSSPFARPEPVSAPVVKKEEDAHGTYTELTILSGPPDPFKYNLVRFKSMNGQPVDMLSFAMPVKLNRKEAKSKITEGDIQGPAQVMMVDGKPVMHDQKPVMVVNVDGVQHTEAKAARLKQQAAAKNAKGAAGEVKKKPFVSKKKTRQVFTVAQEVRDLRKEERLPWLLEDGTEKEVWVGKMNDQNASGTYALFSTIGNNLFRFIPTHRCYDFVPAKRYVASMTSEEAEAKHNRMQNSNSLSGQISRRNVKPSEATLATVAAAEQLQASGGVKVKSEDMGGGFDDDDIKREDLGAEGDFDEMDFEDDVADDEDTMNPDETMEDEDTKESKERIKREQIAANKQNDSRIDDEEDDDMEDLKLKGEGKKIKKALMELDKNDAYDSDDDETKNPYASSENEEEEPETPPVPSISTPGESKASTPKPKGTPKHTRNASNASSRGASPAPNTLTVPASNPTVGRGAALLAKRATSPRPAAASSRAVSPARAASPLSRAASPLPTAPTGSTTSVKSRAPSPSAKSTPVQPGKNKRKAGGEEQATSPRAASPTSQPTASKKPKVTPPPPNPILEQKVIEYLRANPGISTANAISYFKKKKLIAEPESRAQMTLIVQRVANKVKTADGTVNLTLKPEF